MSNSDRNEWDILAIDLERALASLIWDQWFSIGGSASARKKPVPFAVDVEALLLATTRFGIHDPRIFEQATDWLSKNGKLISLQRFKNIQKLRAYGDTERLGNLANFMIDLGFPNWKAVQRDFVAEDPVRYTTREMSQRPHPSSAENLLFTFRNFFGMNARAEIALYLLTHPDPVSATEVARGTSWLTKTIHFTLKEWEQAAVVSSIPVGREQKYLVRREFFTVFYPGEPVGWFNQSAFYLGCHQLVEVLRGLASLKSDTPDMQSILVRRSTDAIRASWTESGTGGHFTHFDSGSRGEKMVKAFSLEVSKVIAFIEERRGLVSSAWRE